MERSGKLWQQKMARATELCTAGYVSIINFRSQTNQEKKQERIQRWKGESLTPWVIMMHGEIFSLG
jgi:hypothetical protein